MEEIRSNILPIDIEDEMKSSFLDYSMSVIVSRALPDVRDGLKPVHRRILYAMNEMSNLYNKPHKKSAAVVGEVMGKYHPHGDQAIYDSLVRMAQDFSMRYPLVDGQGNLGSVDGDPPAAMRYTEARLARISGEMLEDLDKETVAFDLNYDESLQEPLALPAKLPNLLVNGSGGIAVGMTTNIPPHNLREVAAAVRHLIDHPACTIDQLMEHIKGPDFPTGAEIHGEAGIRSAYHTGRGHVVMRAKAEIETVGKTDRERIVVTQIPYQVNKGRLKVAIDELSKEKKIAGLGEVRDESSRKGMRIVIELKKEAPAKVILNQLYKHTQLQETFGVIMIALVDGKPRLMNLKDIIRHFVEHRRRIITARTLFDLRKTKEKEHILAGFIMALDMLDRLIAFIRAAESPETAKAGMMGADFGFSEPQAKAILELRLQRLTAMERQKIIDEREELLRQIDRLVYIRDHEEEKSRIIKEEMTDLETRYGDERRTQITPVESEVDDEDLIAREDVTVTVTVSGYIKRNPVDEYRQQKRGGRGVKGISVQDEDLVRSIFTASTHDNLLLFTTSGRVFHSKVYHVPAASRTAKGKALVNLLQLKPEEKVAAIFPLAEFAADNYLVIATSMGYIKKTPLDAFSRIHQGGIIATDLEEGDGVIGVSVTGGKSQILVSSASGMAIRFGEEDIRPMGRTARGVRAINLDEGDRAVGMAVFGPDTGAADLFTIKEDGYGKRSDLEKYPLQRRGGKGVVDIKCDEVSGKVVAALPVAPGGEIMTISRNGVVIRLPVDDVSVIGRNTKGVRIINLDEADKVVSVGAFADPDKKERE